MAAKSAEKLNWKTSIVDLMKLLGLNSSVGARQELSKELHHTGDTERFGAEEHLAASSSDEQGRRQRRQGAG